MKLAQFGTTCQVFFFFSQKALHPTGQCSDNDEHCTFRARAKI